MKQKYGIYSDLELFRALKNKKETERAFTEIYSRYSQRVYAYCLRITGESEDAKDIYQEVFLRFYKSIDSIDELDNLAGYLLKIARNLCLNFKRDRKLTTTFVESTYNDNSRQFEQRELLEILNMALELLDFDYREVFILRQYQGFSYQEIADIVGDSLPAVKNRYWRAKEKLKVVLSPYLQDL